MSKIHSFQQLGERYPSLRVIAFLFTLIGTMLIAGGSLLLAFGLYALAAGTTAAPPQVAGPLAGPQVHVLPLAPWLSTTVVLVWSFGLLVGGLQMIAMGSLCRLMIHLEENTRATAQVLDKIRSRLESSPEAVEPLFHS
jgi:hypothetical protein